MSHLSKGTGSDYEPNLYRDIHVTSRVDAMFTESARRAMTVVLRATAGQITLLLHPEDKTESSSEQIVVKTCRMCRTPDEYA